jgi:putative transcriptional regulator
MSDILDMAHELAKDLHEVGALDALTMRMMDELCLPQKRSFTAAQVRRIRSKTRMSQPVFALLLGVGASTVAQWEQGNKKPSGSSARLLDVIDRKGVEAIA